MRVLGLSCFYHDSAASLIENGVIRSAAQEERFTRIKHDPAFPKNAVQFCLDEANLKPEQIDAIVFYEKPFLKFERLLETYLTFAPRGLKSFSKALPLWASEKVFQKSMLTEHLKPLGFPKEVSKKIYFSNHHLSHAASSFYCSPFQKSLVLVMDGVGEWASTSVFLGDKSQVFKKKHGAFLKQIKEIPFPHSLGLLYSAFTYHLGFKVNSGEYKIMGLAPYGRPKYVDVIQKNFIRLFDDGSYWLDQKYFDYCAGFTMTNKKFGKVLGLPRRDPETNLNQDHMDLAASIQVVLEKSVLNILRPLLKEFPEYKNLCLAGGVALNCVANGKILKEKLFDDIYIQPAAGDAGGALGAALAFHHSGDGPPAPTSDDLSSKSAPSQDRISNDYVAENSIRGSYLGPSYDDSQIEADLKKGNAVYKKIADSELFPTVAKALSESKAVGWFQGSMEFGPRALGNRSILGDPRDRSMQKTLNLKIKFRESFRPFAPAVLEEDYQSWFDTKHKSPYMLLVADVLKDHQIPMTKAQESLFGLDLLNVPKSKIPAITHVDYSARLQTVSKSTNPRFHKLISEFKAITGVPILVNTSFNVRGEPIVCTPHDAWKCFMGTDLDILVINNYVMFKDQQTEKVNAYHQEFSLD